MGAAAAERRLGDASGRGSAATAGTAGDVRAAAGYGQRPVRGAAGSAAASISAGLSAAAVWGSAAALRSAGALRVPGSAAEAEQRLRGRGFHPVAASAVR